MYRQQMSASGAHHIDRFRETRPKPKQASIHTPHRTAEPLKFKYKPKKISITVAVAVATTNNLM